MPITRKKFLGATAGSTVLLLFGCGGGGGGGNNNNGGNAQSCGADGGAIAGNHGHVLTVATADLDSATSKTYDITGSATHPHTVTFTPAQLQSLKAGQSVTVTSSTDSAHEHTVTASCA
jgi:hypothetical protein